MLPLALKKCSNALRVLNADSSKFSKSSKEDCGKCFGENQTKILRSLYCCDLTTCQLLNKIGSASQVLSKHKEAGHPPCAFQHLAA